MAAYSNSLSLGEGAPTILLSFYLRLLTNTAGTITRFFYFQVAICTRSLKSSRNGTPDELPRQGAYPQTLDIHTPWSLVACLSLLLSFVTTHLFLAGGVLSYQDPQVS